MRQPTMFDTVTGPLAVESTRVQVSMVGDPG
jgi:hypothetical protein